MISVEEALGRVLRYVSVLEAEEKPLLECLGQVLDEAVYSAVDVPPHDNSAMDGYAVQAESIAGAAPSAPVYLDVVAEVRAGTVAERGVGPGEAIRIMTGAPMPAGADTVVPFEDTDEVGGGHHPGRIGIMRQAAIGDNVRMAGEDIARGQLVLERGTCLRPQEIGVMASLGRAQAQVVRRPVVAILATGDEVVEVGQPLAPGKIYNSNSYSIAAQVLRYGGIPRVLGIARDEVAEIEARLSEALSADMLITSGGVSAGDYDLVKEVLASRGEVSFHTVRMKPGKPLAFGVIRGGGRAVPHLGLPGNPVSSMITFEFFARPAILTMMGRRAVEKPMVKAVLEGSVRNSDGRRVFARAQVRREGDRYVARLTGPQGSGVLTSMAHANGLAIVPEEWPSAGDGDIVDVIMLDWSQE